MAYTNVTRSVSSSPEGFALITYTVTGNAGEPALSYQQRINRDTPYTEAESQAQADAILTISNANRQSAQLPPGAVTPAPLPPDPDQTLVATFRDRYLRLVGGRKAQSLGVIPAVSTELDTLAAQCLAAWTAADAAHRVLLLRAMLVVGG